MLGGGGVSRWITFDRLEKMRGPATSSPGNLSGEGKGIGSRDEDGTILPCNTRLPPFVEKGREEITSWRGLCALGPPLYGNLCISFSP